MGNLIKTSNKALDLGALTQTRKARENLARADLHLNEVVRACTKGHRAPPLPPDEFAAALETKSFTSKKADLETVSQLYRSAFEARVTGEKKFVYVELGWGDEDIAVLCRAQRAAAACESLALQGNKMGDEGAAALAQALREGAMPQLAELNLGRNRIGSKGVAALAESLRQGGAPKLRLVWVAVATGFDSTGADHRGKSNAASKADLRALELARPGLKVDRASGKSLYVSA